MKALIQRAAYGMVSVGSSPPHPYIGVGARKLGEIGKGLVVFVGVKRGDAEEQAHQLAQKVLQLRLFSEWPVSGLRPTNSAGKEGPMEKTILEEGGDLLVVPEITLYARTKGGRMDFSEAEEQEKARELFDIFAEDLRKSGLKVEAGIFGEHMLVEIYNDGPVTVTEEV